MSEAWPLVWRRDRRVLVLAFDVSSRTVFVNRYAADASGWRRKYKLPDQQKGQVYLTTHRICYVDSQEPRKHSVALDLKDIERYEFYVSCPCCRGADCSISSFVLTYWPRPFLGWFPQVVSQGDAGSQAAQTCLTPVSSNSFRLESFEKCYRDASAEHGFVFPRTTCSDGAIYRSNLGLQYMQLSEPRPIQFRSDDGERTHALAPLLGLRHQASTVSGAESSYI